MSIFKSNSGLPHLARLSAGKSTVVSVVDVGSSKICCMIARLAPKAGGQELAGRSHSVEILGFGHQKSRGIKSGVVTDMDEAEHAFRLAVDSAERSAGMTVDSLIVCVSAGRLGSDIFSSSVTVGNGEVSQSDVRAALAAGYDHAFREGRTTLHALPVGYSLDGEHGIQDPVSMVGNDLSVDMHMVSADRAPLQNLENCINRSHLSVDAMVAAPYASGLATLVADEARMGCACIDMGGGTTTVSIFLNDHLVHVDAVAIGGNHVTMDLARGLSTTANDAERIKVLYGSALGGAGEHNMISVPPVGGDVHASIGQVSGAETTRMIGPRVEETLEMVRDRINRSGFAGAIGKRFVLTGGASQLPGVIEVATSILGGSGRLGRPMGVSGLPKTAKGPAFSAAAGLLIFPQLAVSAYAGSGSGASYAGAGTLARMGRWLKQNF